MLEDLKINPQYDGFIFLAEAFRNPPLLRPHRHVELELNLVIEGTITYVVGGQRLRFGKRSLLWIFPEQEHQLIDRSQDARYYVVVFKPAMIAHACQGGAHAALLQKEPEDGGVLQTELLPDSFELVRKSMDLLLEDGLGLDVLNREAGFGMGSDFRYEHGDPDWLNAGLRHLLLLGWRQMRNRSDLNPSVNLHPAITRALSKLGGGQWTGSLDELGRACGVSGSYLSRLFVRQIGVSLTRYRNSVRLSTFWEALQSSKNRTITEAVYAAGFGSYAQFYKVFVDAYGTSPRDSLRRMMSGRSVNVGVSEGGMDFTGASG